MAPPPHFTPHPHPYPHSYPNQVGTKLRIEVASLRGPSADRGGAASLSVAQLGGGSKPRTHSFFRGKKKGGKKKGDEMTAAAAARIVDDDEEELARSPSLGEVASTTDTR